MRAVIQRVSQAKVEVENKLVSEIAAGLLVLVGVEEEDTDEDVQWLAKKMASLRIFSDEQGLMNLDVKAIGGKFLLVSQFTLHAKTKKGTRPSFTRAAQPEKANLLFEKLAAELSVKHQVTTETGVFGANMQVQLVNDGPVTIIIDTKNKE